MIIVTSISPSHKNMHVQKECINSWIQFGPCYSLNTDKEIGQIGEDSYTGIKFISTDRTVDALFYGKSLVSVNAIIDFAKSMREDLLVINSDIYLRSLPEFKQDGITIISRHDYEETMGISQIFSAGYDVFFIPKKLLGIYPPSIYALGAAWHDFMWPYRAIVKNIPVYYPTAKHAFHKKHDIQYSLEEWYRIGQYFAWEFNLGHNTHDFLRKAQPLREISVQQICTQSLAKIKQHLVHI